MREFAAADAGMLREEARMAAAAHPRLDGLKPATADAPS